MYVAYKSPSRVIRKINVPRTISLQDCLRFDMLSMRNGYHGMTQTVMGATNLGQPVLSKLFIKIYLNSLLNLSVSSIIDGRRLSRKGSSDKVV